VNSAALLLHAICSIKIPLLAGWNVGDVSNQGYGTYLLLRAAWIVEYRWWAAKINFIFNFYLFLPKKIQYTSVNPDSLDPNLRQNRIKLVVRMISNVILYKNLRFVRIFWSGSSPIPDKICSFLSSNPDFSALSRCCVVKFIDWSLGKIRQLSDATQECLRSTTSVLHYDNNGRNCRQHWTYRRNDYYVTHRHGISRWISSGLCTV